MTRVVRALLRFYPAGFRSRYGAEVVTLLRQQAADVRRREGRLAVARLWLFQAVDLVRAAFAERRGDAPLESGSASRGHGRAAANGPRRRGHGGTAANGPRRRGDGGAAADGPGRRALRGRSAGSPPSSSDPGIGGVPSRAPTVRTWGEGVGRDVRHALRALGRAPAFSLVATVTLALGISATSAIFTVIDGVLLSPLAYPEADRLVAVFHRMPAQDFSRVNHTDATYLTYHDENRSFESIGAWRPGQATVTGLDEPETIPVVVMSEGVFDALDVQPILGRRILVEDTVPGAPFVVVLSHGYWSRRLGADPTVIGDVLRLDGIAAEIVGVMGPDFRFLDEDASAFLGLRLDRSATSPVVSFDYRVIARLAEGVTAESAEQDLLRLLPASAERYGWIPATQLEEWDLGIRIVPLKDAVVDDIGEVLWVLLGAVSIVLLIACVNVANLLLARSEGRQREIAMRSALGASRAHLIRQFFIESAVLSAFGAAVGLALAYAAVPALIRLAPAVVPRAAEIRIDASVFLFTLVVSTGAAAIFGLLPVIQRRSTALVPALKEGGHGASAGRRRSRVRYGLAVAEVALAVVLLVGAGLMVRSFLQLRGVDPGFSDPRRAVTFRLALPRAEAPDEDEAILVYEQIIDRIAAIPGVSEVGAISGMTMEGRSNQNSFIAEGVGSGESDGAIGGFYKAIAGDYFSAAGIPLLAGRSINWQDIRERRPVGVVTETLARAFWGDARSAIGKRIRHSDDDPWREIIGVVGDVRDGGLRGSPRAVAYWPVLVEDFLGFESWLRREMAFVVRTERENPLDLVASLRQAVWSVRPNLPLVDIGTLERLVQRDMADTTFMLTMLLVAAGVAVALGTVGIYGVISYTFEQRLREIGIRVALGATRRDVLSMVLRQGATIGLVGVAVGVAVAAGSARLLAARTFGVSPLDGATYASAAALAGAVAMLASYVPARRAARSDPLDSLRK